VVGAGDGWEKKDEVRRGLNIKTRISPTMINISKKMHFRRPVLRWYLKDDTVSSAELHDIKLLALTE
jgi:hypothetical protein